MHQEPDELKRLEALRSYELLDTAPEEAFDNIVKLASKLFATPIALISLIDEGRQWFKAKIGLDVSETPRDYAFCDHAIRQAGPMTVSDATLDPRFANNPLVTGQPGIRFYCGVPLLTPEGHGLGTLCIIDRKPREIDPATIEILSRLATMVEREFEVLRRLHRVEKNLETATESQRAKELLAAMLVHDLRGPLNVIGLVAELLTTSHPAKRRELYEVMASVDTMREMLSDVLDICLSDHGQLQVRPRTIAVQSLLGRLAPAWRLLVGKRSGHLTVAHLEEPLTLHADSELLTRALNNLLSNAIAYGPIGQTVIVRARTRDGGGVRFEVVDQARRIPDAAREAIFRPFERLGRNQQGGGYGLGLAFCQLVMDAHGGSIGVLPSDGGNTFFLEFPGE